MLPKTQKDSRGHFAVYYDKSQFFFFVHPYRICNIILVCVNNGGLKRQSKKHENMKKTVRARLKNG